MKILIALVAFVPIGAFAVVGDVVQVKENDTSGTSISVTLDSTATSGNLILACIHADTNASHDTKPSGYTLIQEVPDFSSGQTWFGYKTSDGTETSLSSTWSTSSGLSMAVVEYEWGQGAPTISSNENNANVGGSTTATLTTGSVTPDEATNLMVACLGNDFGGGFPPTIDNSFTVDEETGLNSYTAAALASKVDQSGAVNPEWSDGGTGNNYWAALAAFSYSAGGTAIPTTLRRRRD